MVLVKIAPGQSPGFTATLTPTGAVATASQVVWTSSDTVDAPVTQNASDPTGLMATVNLPLTAKIGKTFTLTLNMTNADGTKATPGTITETIVAPDATAVTITQTT